MTWKKAAIVLAVIISLSSLGKLVYVGIVRVSQVSAFVDKTDRRHTQEDLIFLERREQSLIEKRDMGRWLPSDVDEMIRLQNQIKELKKELGYL